MKHLLATLTVLLILANISFLLWKIKGLPSEEQIVYNPPPSVVPVTPPHVQPDTPPQRQTVPTFVTVPVARQHSENSVYGDIMKHSQESPFGDAHGRATNSHETTHGINSYLRNKYFRELNKKVNGFYVLNGRGVIIEEPNIRKSRVAEFVPQNLRSYRYSTYITGQQAWDDTPLYIFDEWVAYVNGGKTNVEDVKAGRYKGGWTDGVSGCLGFSIYSVALAMAVEKYDPGYWGRNEQFRNFLIWHLKEAQKTYFEGHKMRDFAWDKQDKLLDEFLNSSSAEPMRRFVRENLEGVWLDAKIMTPYFERKPGEEIRLEQKCHCHR